MTAIVPDGSLLPRSNAVSSGLPRYAWQSQIPPITFEEVQTRVPKSPLPVFKDDGVGLGSPLQGLPRQPPAPKTTRLDQTLGAVHFFKQYPPQHSETPSLFHERLWNIGQRLTHLEHHPVGSNSFQPRTTLSAQHTPSSESFSSYSVPRVQNAFAHHFFRQSPEQQVFESNSAQILAPNRVRTSVPPFSVTEGLVPGHSYEAQNPASPVRETDRPAFRAQFEGEASPSDTSEDDTAVPAGPRKRGRPKGSGVKPNKRKKGENGPGGWSRGMHLGPRKAIDPGPEFNALFLQATEAYMDEGDTEKGYELIMKAISVNPEIYAAHVLLADIFEARGEDEKALVALLTGAHTMPTDPEVWFTTAHAHLEKLTGDREQAAKAAVYCYTRILHVNSARERHVEARFQRATLYRELAQFSKAMVDLEVLLVAMPRNSSVLRQIAELALDIKDVTKAKELYEDTLAYYRENGFEDEESFTWTDVLVYAQILANEEPPEIATSHALKILKQLSRWLLGREEEAYWDQLEEDDREFDAEDDRRVLLPEFVPGRHPFEAYGEGIPIEVRVRLGVLRLRQGEDAVDEAMAHLEWLDPESREEGASIYQYPDLFLEVAQSLLEIKEYNQALRYFQALKETNAYAHTDFWMGIGVSSFMCGDRLLAVECYEEAKIGDAKSVEARTQLCKVFTDLGDKEMATEYGREAVRLAESLLPNYGKRKYEPRDLRLSRERAEDALKEASQLAGDYSGGVAIWRIESKMDVLGRGRHRKRMPKKVPAKSIEEAGHRGTDVEHDDALAPDIEREMARQIVRSVTSQRDDRLPARFEAHKTKHVYKVRRMTVKERDARRTDTINGLYGSLLENTDDMRNGDERARHTWMKCADTLLKDFKNNRSVYDRKQATNGVTDEVVQTSKTKDDREGTQEEDLEVDPDIPLPSVESTLPTEYREIPFSDWLDVFLEYALLQSRSPDADVHRRCYNIIDGALGCIIWNRDPQTMLQIHITYLACALALKDDDTLYNVVLKWFMKTYEFNDDAYRLVAAINLVYPHTPDKKGKEGQMSNAMFRGRAMHRFVLTQLCQADSSLPMDYSPEEYGPVPSFMRKNGGGDVQSSRSKDAFTNTPVSASTPATLDTEDTPAPAEQTPGLLDQTPTPSIQASTPQDQHLQQHDGLHPSAKITELSSSLLLLYGQILSAGGVHTAALSYFLRAQSLDPRNPVILLSIALSYMHHMLMKRCDNRHMMLMQGWAFFEEYAECRINWARERVEKWIAKKSGPIDGEDLDLTGLGEVVVREIEFNRARCWHMLGMADLAVKGYETVLSIAVPPAPIITIEETTEHSGVKHSDFGMDAAYAMSTIYALSGNTQMAREVTEKYLVV